MPTQTQTAEATRQGKRPASKKTAEKPAKSNHMSTADYDKRRAAIEESFEARFEQELSKLFIASGWTQEKWRRRRGSLRVGLISI